MRKAYISETLVRFFVAPSLNANAIGTLTTSTTEEVSVSTIK